MLATASDCVDMATQQLLDVPAQTGKGGKWLKKKKKDGDKRGKNPKS